MSTDNVEKPTGTDKGINSFFANKPRTVCRRTETNETTTLLRLVRILGRVLENWENLLSLKLQKKIISLRWCEKLSKTPGHNGIRGRWLKKFTSIHNRLTNKNNICLQETDIPERMTKGKSTRIPKEPKKRHTPYNN